MRKIKIAAAAALFVAAVATLTPGIGADREHILSADAEIKREHIL